MPGPIRKNIKLSPEMLQQLGALHEAAQMVKDDLKEIVKEMRERGKEVRGLGLDPESDTRLQDMGARKAALELKKFELKEQQDNEKRGVMDEFRQAFRRFDFTGLPQHLSQAPGALGTITSSIGRLGAFMQGGARYALEAGLVRGSTAAAIAGAGATLAAGATGAAIALAPLAAAYLVGAGLSNLAWRQKAAADSSKRVADMTLEFINQGGGDTPRGADFLIQATRAAAAQGQMGQALETATDPTERLRTWLTGSPGSDALAKKEHAIQQEMHFQEFSRTMGANWREANSLAALENAPDFKLRMHRKNFNALFGAEGYYGLRASYEGLKALFNAATGGNFQSFNDNISFELRQEMQTKRMQQAADLRAPEHLFPHSPDWWARRDAEQRARSVWVDGVNTRKYFSSQQWNKF